MSRQYPDLPEYPILYDENERCEQWWIMGTIIPGEWNGFRHQEMVYYANIHQFGSGAKIAVTSDMGETFVWGEQSYTDRVIAQVNVCPATRRRKLDLAFWGWLDQELEKVKKVRE